MRLLCLQQPTTIMEFAMFVPSNGQAVKMPALVLCNRPGKATAAVISRFRRCLPALAGWVQSEIVSLSVALLSFGFGVCL